ncbi:hypothetical protein BDW75DRAFT_204934 [Aspergillus navahoensis]
MAPTNLTTDRTYHQVDASDAKARYQKYELMVTGHSLGGALATLHVVFLRNRGVAANLVSPFHYDDPSRVDGY